MIAHLIRWSVGNRLLVLLAAFGLGAWGLWALLRAPLDALPDLSDMQVIVRAQYPGQAPQIVEDQVTYPLTTTMLSVPGAKSCAAISFFGDSFVYVLFDDGTDPYWARSRVLEYLSQVQARLPAGARPRWGRTPPAWAGSTSTPWSIAPATHDIGSCARCRTGFSSRAEDRAGCGRGGEHRRHGPAVPGRRRPGPLARVRPAAARRSSSALQSQSARPAVRSSRWGKPSTWCARAAT